MFEYGQEKEIIRIKSDFISILSAFLSAHSIEPSLSIRI